MVLYMISRYDLEYDQTEPPEKSHTQVWECRGSAVDLLFVSVLLSHWKPVLSTTLVCWHFSWICRGIHFKHWYSDMAGNTPVVGMTQIVVILMAADFHGEWNTITFKLWVFAFYLVHAMLNVMLPGASMQENLRSGLLQSNRAAHAAVTCLTRNCRC